MDYHRRKITIDTMRSALEHARPAKEFKPGMTIRVRDKMQRYSYTLTEPIGRNFHPDFKPDFSPKQMLDLGVFEGKYCNDCIMEFPREWFRTAISKKKVSPEGANEDVNYFGIKSRLSLQEWLRRGWIPCHTKDKDIRGWFQWFMRYWLGRRIPDVDAIQIKRWSAFKRHYAQVKKNARGNLSKRPRQRQALLQWSWDCFI